MKKAYKIVTGNKTVKYVWTEDEAIAYKVHLPLAMQYHTKYEKVSVTNINNMWFEVCNTLIPIAEISNVKSKTIVDDQGKLVQCYHNCKSILKSPEFWIGTLIAFPIEHALWEKTPLKFITDWLGL